MNKNEIPVHIDITELDTAIEKASRLKELLQEVQTLIYSLSGTNQIEKLLGTVRKAEKRTENRYYNNRTNIVEGILKEEGQ